MWRAAIWSTEMPAFGFVERGGGTQLSHVPGMIECTEGLSAGRLPSPLTTVRCCFSAANGSRIGFKSKSLPTMSGVQAFTSLP